MSGSSFDMPEVPKACVKCGTPYGLTRQPVVAPGFRSGIDLPFCQACWKRIQLARRVRVLAIGVASTILLGGLVLYQATGRQTPVYLALALDFAVVAAAQWFSRRALPKYAARGGAVEIDVPGSGKVRLAAAGDDE